MSYLYVRWNSFGLRLLADVSDIRAWFVFRWPLPQRRPATPEAERLGRSGGSGQGRIVGRSRLSANLGKCRRLQHLHYFRAPLRDHAPGRHRKLFAGYFLNLLRRRIIDRDLVALALSINLPIKLE